VVLYLVQAVFCGHICKAPYTFVVHRCIIRDVALRIPYEVLAALGIVPIKILQIICGVVSGRGALLCEYGLSFLAVDRWDFQIKDNGDHGNKKMASFQHTVRYILNIW
jgi:hypothetical protein